MRTCQVSSLENLKEQITLYATKDKVWIGITKTTGVFSTHGFCRYGRRSETGWAEARHIPSPPPQLKNDEHGHSDGQGFSIEHGQGFSIEHEQGMARGVSLAGHGQGGARHGQGGIPEQGQGVSLSRAWPGGSMSMSMSMARVSP